MFSILNAVQFQEFIVFIDVCLILVINCEEHILMVIIVVIIVIEKYFGFDRIILLNIEIV